MGDTLMVRNDEQARDEVLLSSDGVACLGRLISGAISVAGCLRTTRLAGNEILTRQLEQLSVAMLDQLGNRTHFDFRKRVIGQQTVRGDA